jgi:hypothetical protein
MVNRFAISSLWFVSFLCVHELVWSLSGSPRLLGIVLGGSAAAFFWFDPFHLFRVASPAPLNVAGIDQALTRGEGSRLLISD